VITHLIGFFRALRGSFLSAEIGGTKFFLRFLRVSKVWFHCWHFWRFWQSFWSACIRVNPR